MDEPVELLSVGSHDGELAELVGQVVMQVSELDYWACHLVASVLGGDDETWERYWGRSGRQLERGLGLAAVRDVRVAAVVGPFRSVSERRNQVVHGLWFADGERRGTFEAMKPAMGTNGETHDGDFTLVELRTLVSDARRVSDYVWALYVERIPARQYGTGELVPRTPLILPDLTGIDAAAG